jgi:hypothetical protein
MDREFRIDEPERSACELAPTPWRLRAPCPEDREPRKEEPASAGLTGARLASRSAAPKTPSHDRTLMPVSFDTSV